MLSFSKANGSAVNSDESDGTCCFQCLMPLLPNDEFQFIFDELGKDMDLEGLLLQCYEIKVIFDSEKFQALCEDCLNELIDTFDRLEFAKKDKPTEEFLELDSEELIEDSQNEESNNQEYKHLNFLENISECEEHTFEYQIDNGQGTIEGFLRDDFNENVDNDAQKEEFIIEELTMDGDRQSTLEGDREEDPEMIVQDDDFQDQQTQPDSNYQLDDEELISVDYSDNSNDVDDPGLDMKQIYEEIDYLEEADDFPKLKEYIKTSICSNFKDIAFPETIECQLCNEKLDRHVSVMDHCFDEHCIDDTGSLYACVINKQCAPLKSEDEASFHYVFQHYDLETLAVYAQCKFCMKRFNNLLLFNKHSCYHSRTMSRSATECSLCGKCFRSNKRYRFHLQFHLEKHRLRACIICQTYIQDEDEFFEHIMYNHEQENSLVCRLCDRNFIQQETFDAHKSVHHMERPFACTLCDKSYLHSQQLQDHMNSQHLQERVYQCTICEKQFFKQNILRKHLLNHNEPIEGVLNSCEACGFLAGKPETVREHIDIHHNDANAYRITPLNLLIAYCCEYCEMAYDCCENLNLHRKQHTDKMYLCQMCPLTFDQFKKVKIHRQTHQKYAEIRKSFPVMRHYVCDIDDCTSNYHQWIGLMSHKRNFHLVGKQRPYRCEVCQEACVNRTTLNQHIRDKHGKDTNFPCPFCEKEYRTPMAIAVHVARMHNNNKLACEQCGTLCNNKEALKKHIVNTHDILTCSICQKVLKNMKNLRTHIKMVHRKEKRYFCKFCKRGYFNNCDRITHEEAIHLKNKLHTCDICSYTTPYKESILVHMKNHTNTKPYECTLCHKRFSRKYSLTLHFRRHADVRKYVCPFSNCTSSYPNEAILRSHIKNKHTKKTVVVTEIETEVEADEPQAAFEDFDEFNEEPLDIDDVPAEYFVDDDDGLNDDLIVETLSNIGDNNMEYVLNEFDSNDVANIIDEEVVYSHVVLDTRIQNEICENENDTYDGSEFNELQEYEVVNQDFME